MQVINVKFETAIVTQIPTVQIDDIFLESDIIIIDSKLNIKFLKKEKYAMVKTLEQLKADLIMLISEIKSKDIEAVVAEESARFAESLRAKVTEESAKEIAEAEINLKFIESKLAEQAAEESVNPTEGE